MNNFFESKVILVTGGTGSIGSEIVHQLLKMSPRVVRIFSRDEYKQFCIQQELGNRSDVRYLLGDVREGSRLLRAAEGVDIIFHCAAYKHVPFCEYNPFEAVKTNVIGTQNVIEAALAQGVRKVLLISTDKAASPLNVMGATKLLAERLMSSTMHSIGSHNTILASVRFGNVLGSRGSVIPLFRDQIAKGGPLTITHPEMTRFFMSIPQAVKLVFSAAELMKGGELFILKMPAARVGDIADVLIEVLAPRFRYDPTSMEKKIIGVRPGEKMFEVLMTKEESEFATESDSMFIVSPYVDLPVQDPTLHKSAREKSVTEPRDSYSSDKVHILSKDEIRELLVQERVL